MPDAIINCRELAQAMQAQRVAAEPEKVAQLSSRFGIDAALNLTQIEGLDLGDADAGGDMPDIHALRYMPISHFQPGDTAMMITYGQSPAVMLPLARLTLEGDPPIEAQFYQGDLLLAVARLIARRTFDEKVAVPVPSPLRVVPDGADWALALIDAADAQLWKRFARAADGRSAEDVEDAREQILNGPVLTELSWFDGLDDIANMIAEARAWLQPPHVVKRSYVQLLYVVPQRGRLQAVRVDDDDDGIEELITQARHAFERMTVFEIVHSPEGLSGMEGNLDEEPVDGVRLLMRSASAIEDWRGTWFEEVEEAIEYAEEAYGVPPQTWEDPDITESGPADHNAYD